MATALPICRYEDEFQATLRQLVSDLQSLKKKVGGLRPALAPVAHLVCDTDDKGRALKSCEGLVTELKEMVCASLPLLPIL